MRLQGSPRAKENKPVTHVRVVFVTAPVPPTSPTCNRPLPRWACCSLFVFSYAFPDGSYQYTHLEENPLPASQPDTWSMAN